MKKFLIEIFIFFLILIIIMFGINLFQSKYNNSEKQYEKQYHEIFTQNIKANAIIIGTSHAVHSIRPSLINSIKENIGEDNKNILKFYNFAFNGSNPKFYLNWYNEIFKPNYIKPKVVIIGVDWFMFDEKWLWRHIEQDSEFFPSDLFCYFWWNNNSISRSFKKSDLIINRYPFLKYRQKIKYSLLLWKGNPDFSIKSYDNGFIAFEKKMTKESAKPTNDIVQINLKQVEYFKKLINELIKDKIKIIFLMSPEYNIPIEYYNNSESLNLLKNIAYNNNIPFLNYNIELRSYINDNKEFYSDWGHMNTLGSIEFSKKLSIDLYKVINN